MQQLRTELSNSQQNAKKSSIELANSKLVIHTYRQKHECEALYADGHVIDAAMSLSDITRSINDYVKSDVIIIDWLSGGFHRHCREGRSITTPKVYK